jgi:hypothetical protein
LRKLNRRDLKSILTLAAAVLSITSFGQILQGTTTLSSVNNQVVTVTVNNNTNVVTITMTGTNNAYFAVGFGAAVMNGTYCIVDNGTGSLTERDLGNGSAGTLLTSSITSSSTSLAGSVRTTTLQRPRVGLNANYYTFPNTPGTYALIWARGSGTSFVQHSQRGSATITLTNACNLPITPTPGVILCSGDSALVFGNYVKSSGIYFDTLSSVIGCDSVLSKAVQVRGGVFPQAPIALCQGTSTTLFGQVVSQPGTYSDTLTSGGCDSIVTAVVTVTPVDTALAFDPNSPYSLTSSATNATFQWLDCTTGTLLAETSNQFIAQTPGSYAGIITQNGCTDTSECFTLSAWNLAETAGTTVVLYPNPAQGFVSVKGLSDGQFKITDLLGKVVLEGSFTNGTIDLVIIPRGIYQVELQSGGTIYRTRLAAE